MSETITEKNGLAAKSMKMNNRLNSEEIAERIESLPIWQQLMILNKIKQLLQ